MGHAEFISNVADPFRGASPAPNNSHVHGGGFQTPNPAVAAWLDKNPEVSEVLAATSSAVAVLEGNHEGALIAFAKAREAFDEAKGAESRAHYDAREHGKTVDPDVAKRLLRSRQSAGTASEEAVARATTASNSFAATRDALNEAVKFVGGLAGERSGVVLAPTVTLPEGPLTAIIAAQRETLRDLDIEKSEIESAPLPLEEAIVMVRASVVRGAPTIELGPRRVDWIAPQKRLYAAPLLGDVPVDIDNTTALLGWLFGDQLADKLEAAVRDRYIGVERTYSPAERQKALTDVTARRSAAERLEVAAVFKSWAEGNYVPLRRDVSPVALLGIAKVTEGAKEPADYAGSAYLGQRAR